jgi:hypothetical protein
MTRRCLQNVKMFHKIAVLCFPEALLNEYRALFQMSITSSQLTADENLNVQVCMVSQQPPQKTVIYCF